MVTLILQEILKRVASIGNHIAITVVADCSIEYYMSTNKILQMPDNVSSNKNESLSTDKEMEHV